MSLTETLLKEIEEQGISSLDVGIALVLEIRRLRGENTRQELEMDWLIKHHKCKTNIQAMAMQGICPAKNPKTRSENSTIKTCGIYGFPYYTDDECVQLWRKLDREAV